MNDSPSYALYEKIYTVCEQLPHGTVASYGEIAAIIGGGCDARTVGYALNEVPKQRGVPWQRIISKQGSISTRGLTQRELLEAEGVEFDERGFVILARFRWDGPSAEWAAEHGFQTLPARDQGDRAEQMSLF